jgi:hypothetical protein
MKHIKHYETIENVYPDHYIIYHTKDKKLYIIMKILQNNWDASSSKIYKMFQTPTTELKIEKYHDTVDDMYWTSTKHLINNSEYIANNIDDCLKQIKILIETNKYNL